MTPAIHEETAIGPVEIKETGVQWRRYIAALGRYKWLMLLVTVVGTGAGVAATRFVKPEYVARATIWIESGPQKNGPLQPNQMLDSYAWVELLRTNVVLDSVALKLRLFLETEDPKDRALVKDFSLAETFRPGEYTVEVDGTGKRYVLRSSEGTQIETGAVGDSIGTHVGFRWAPAPGTLGRDRTIGFTVTTPREVAGEILNNLRTQMAEEGNFLRVSLSGTEPERMAMVLNAVTEQFVAIAADLKRGKLTELSKTLRRQVDTTAQQLKEAETALQSYRTKIITLPSEGTPIAPGLAQTQGTVMANFFGQKVQLEQLRHERKALEDVLARGQGDNLAVDAFQTIPAVQQSTNLSTALKELASHEASYRALTHTYTDEYQAVKDVKDKIQTLRSQTIPSYSRQLIDQLKVQEKDLESQIGTASRDLEQIPSRTITEQRLTREMQSLEGLYRELQSRYETAKLSELSAVPDVKILDVAVPPKLPTSNSAPRIILMAFLASLGIAVGLALLLDQLDKRFRYPEQVSHELGLSILGAIPAIKKIKGGDLDPGEASQVVEAFRTIRLNLAHSYGSAGPVLLTVTSPGAGDGKSLISSNLALSFAEAGYRTLLVDGDIRRGELHRMFSIGRRPGLVDYLAGGATLEEIMRSASQKGLTIIPSGIRRHHGPELLGSSAMSQLMAEMKARFNVIIVDSPPLGAGIDPFVLGTATGHLLLVLRSGETDRQMAEAKLKLIDRLPIRVLGAVLNDIRTGEGLYRYYSYIYGYTADEEETAPQQLAGKVGEVSPET